MGLYDSYLTALGNDSTVLVTNEMGGEFTAGIYNVLNNELIATKGVNYKTYSGIFNCNTNGSVIGFVSNDRVNKTSIVELFNCRGLKLLSKTFSHTINGGLFFSDNAEYFAIILSAQNEKHFGVFTRSGEHLFKLPIERKGSYNAVFSDKYIVVYSWNNLYYIDKSKGELLAEYIISPNRLIRIDEVRISESDYILYKENYLEWKNKKVPPKVDYSLLYKLDILGNKEQIERINNL